MEQSSPQDLVRPLGVRLITLQKGIWGSFLLIAAMVVGILRWEHIAEPVQFILQELSIDPRSRLWSFLVGLLPSIDFRQLTRLSLFLLVYAVVSLVESWGVWYRKLWVEIFLVLETAAFLPLEIIELIKKLSFLKLGLFVINLLIVIYLANEFWRKWQAEHKEHKAL
ncbi:MAG: DUF2127 domain-containing protein [Gloeobacterales cyanobacterium]